MCCLSVPGGAGARLMVNADCSLGSEFVLLGTYATHLRNSGVEEHVCNWGATENLKCKANDTAKPATAVGTYTAAFLSLIDEPVG